MNSRSKSTVRARGAAKAASNAGAAKAQTEPQTLADDALDHVRGAAGTVWDYIKKNDLQDKAKKTL